MEVLDGAPLGDGETGQVHKTGHVAADKDVRIGLENMVEFQGTHAAGNVGKRDGKGAAEAAALLGLTEGGDFGVADGFKEFHGGLTTAGAATVARAMEGDACRLLEFAGPFFNAQAVVNEIHDFPGAAGQRVDGGIRALLELEKISVEIHGGTGAGGNDDRQVAGEDGSSVAGDFAGGNPVTGIERRLAAAGLVVGELDGDAKVFENFDGGARDVVVEGVAKASAHKEHTFVGGALERGGHG